MELMQEPLSDLKVLSFTHAASGPYAGWLLTEWGADVVKVEPPGGAFERESAKHHHYLSNCGKRSLCVDLKSDQGKEVIYDLVEEYDIVLESYRPGVMDKLGVGYETLSEINDELIYCSISGFGDTGPYRDRPAFDPIAQALSGVMAMTGNPDRKPSRVGAPLIDLGTATNAILSIMMAVHQRSATGEGQRIETSLFETAFGWGGMWAVFYSLHGTVPERMGDKIATYAPVGAYETTDNEAYLSALGDPSWKKLARALDLEELITHPDFETADQRRENRDQLDSQIEARTRNYSTDDLVSHLLDHNVPVAEINTVPEVLEDEHLEAREMFRNVRTESGDELVAPSVPMKSDSASPRNATSPPDLGEHTIDVLQEAGYSKQKVEALLKNEVTISSEDAE